jgi:hypothetical protein
MPPNTYDCNCFTRFARSATSENKLTGSTHVSTVVATGQLYCLLGALHRLLNFTTAESCLSALVLEKRSTKRVLTTGIVNCQDITFGHLVVG